MNNIRFTFWDRSRLDTGQRPGELNKGKWNDTFLSDKFLILDLSEVELYSRFNSRRETLLPTNKGTTQGTAVAGTG